MRQIKQDPSTVDDQDNNGPIDLFLGVRHYRQPCKLYQTLNTVRSDIAEQISRKLSAEWPNTYAYNTNIHVKLRAEGGTRRGNMGHLTRIANMVVHNLEKGPVQAQIADLIKGIYSS